MEIAPGAVHLPQYLSVEDQRVLVDRCRALIDGPTPLHLVEKPTPGTGATLLVDVLTFARVLPGDFRADESVTI